MFAKSITLPVCLLLLILSCSTPKEPSLPHWEMQHLGRSASIRGLCAVDENTAWLSGTGNTIARTTDGGQTWTTLPSPTEDTLDFRDIQAFDQARAVVMSAGPGTKSRIYTTSDGGQNWQLILTNTHEQGFFNGMAFWNDREGLLTGDPIDSALFILTTADGGNSWQRVPPENIPPIRSGEYGFAASGTHITVWGDRQAWIGTGGQSARVFWSADKGKTWNAAETPMMSGRNSTGIFSLAFRTTRDGIAVGGDFAREKLSKDNVMITSDGGQTWRLVEGHQVPYRSCVQAVEGGYVAAGPSGSNISFDQGRTWLPLDSTGFHVLSAVKGTSAVWAAGADGRVGRLVW